MAARSKKCLRLHLPFCLASSYEVFGYSQSYPIPSHLYMDSARTLLRSRLGAAREDKILKQIPALVGITDT